MGLAAKVIQVIARGIDGLASLVAGVRGLADRLGERVTDLFVYRPEAAAPYSPPPRLAASDPMESQSDSRPAAVTGDEIRSALAHAPARGEEYLPDDLDTLGWLLRSPPADDHQAADLLRGCFLSLGEAAGRSRALLAVAIRLGGDFGQPTRRPLAARAAWRMLDPEVFEADIAEHLQQISHFILHWQKEHQDFLCLDFAEIELIEYLFEALPPAAHAALLADVMSFKVLSNRRMGTLRRIPHRVRRWLREHEAAAGPAHVAGTIGFLDQLAKTHGYPPIIEAATIARDELEKVLAALVPPPATGPPADGGAALGRITPVKVPAALAQPGSPPPVAVAPPVALPDGPGAATGAAAAIQPDAEPSSHFWVVPDPCPVSAHGVDGTEILMGQPYYWVVAPVLQGRNAMAAMPTEPLPPIYSVLPRRGVSRRTASSRPRGGEAPSDRRRSLSAEEKHQAVLQVLGGASPSTVAEGIGVSPDSLGGWVKDFVTAGASAMSQGPAPAAIEADLPEVDLLRERLSDLLHKMDVIEQALGGRGPEAKPRKTPKRPAAPRRRKPADPSQD